jgi:23S rRNA pseudouridine1911/1915/1917 synthase
MLDSFEDTEFVVAGGEPAPLERVLRDRFAEASWSAIRRLITSNKVLVGGQTCVETRALVNPGATVAIRMNARRPSAGGQAPSETVLYCDDHVLVARKPAGINSVRAEDNEPCLQENLEKHLRATTRGRGGRLHVVHRLDKITSGVLIFARTTEAQSALKDQFRAHTTERVYDAVVHGTVLPQTLHFRLIRDRGDGLRGVTSDQNQGVHSVTHIAPRERLPGATLIECRLETGRTHQIRIHLAHIGHPLVGEPLYVRDYRGTWLASPRALLHARSLSFTHPVYRKRLAFAEPLPKEFAGWLEQARASGR